MILNSGVHPSLYEKRHHQIIFAKISLKIDFPLPYERTLWYYSKADSISINRCIHQLDWLNAFSGRNIDEQVNFF